jgi:hypothetical protein
MNDVVSFTRQKVLRLEKEMRLLPLQITPGITNYFGHKSYLRSMILPAGTALVGKIHKYKQIHILLQGEISVLTDDGPLRITAPAIFEAPAGSKRAAYAHEDTIWATVHGTEKTTEEELEEELISQSFEAFDQFCLENKS